MGLIREPEDVDFVIESQPWADEELAEFRILLKKLKEARQVESAEKALKRTSKNQSTGQSA